MNISSKFALLTLLSFLFIHADFAQNNSASDSIDLTVIDSYVSPEIPHTFTLTFFTGFNCKSKVLIDKKYEYKVSDTLVTSHSVKVDLTNLSFKTKSVPFTIIVTDSAGKKYEVGGNEFDLPGEVKIEGESNFLLLCLFGGAVFALPSPTYVSQNGASYFSLTKEIPIISFRSSNYTYPFGYISAEYSHIFKASYQNYLRLGYKEMITMPVIEYVSPGVNWFTTFKGFNGVSAELSLGLVRIFNTFTVYTRYRYNVQPNNSGSNFHEISIGLYSSFFSVYF
ncbi:MAG: hypothetical protein P4L45_13365 [Ignavibacteriaceae bacterium]|nr:hypothetical protein [Ignavibacteriaceae bacterium]